MSQPQVFIIAEAGVNHNGSLAMAKQLADAAKAAGADAVKFQTFTAEDVVTPDAATADYQKANTGATSQFDMIKQLELDMAQHRELAAYCRSIDIEFFSTPFSEAAVGQLLELGVVRLKLPSGEITNKSLIECAAATGLPLLMSTGMSTMAEVQTAIGWVQATWRHHGITVAGPQPLLVMHCTSAYPAPADSLNLRALRTMATELNLPIGYSDHSLGLEAALGAVALGAVALEKHLTLDKNLPGPDHLASSNPAEFAALVQSVRKMQAMLGDGVKQPQPIERNTRDVARRSLVLARDMKRGEVLASGDVVLRRPGTGMAPVELPQVLGRPLNRDVAAHTLLAPDMVGT